MAISTPTTGSAGWDAQGNAIIARINALTDDVTNRVPPAMLGLGTRDGTKYLRDDGNWTVPSIPAPTLPWFNVKDYGALGNGTQDDTTAIAAALSAANTAGGGVVLFPPGTYMISATLNIGSNGNVLLRGSGMRISILKVMASGVTGSRMIYANGVAGVSIEHLGFDGSTSTTMYKAFETSGALTLQRVKIHDCYFTAWKTPTGWTQANADLGAILLWSSTSLVGQVWIERNDFVACAKGVRCYFPTDGVIIRGNRFYNTATKGMQVGVELVGSTAIESSAVVSNNYVDGANWDPSPDPGGLLGNGIVVFGCRGATVANNTIKNCGDPASQQASGGIGVRSALGGGILIGQGSQGAQVVANDVHDCQQHGIYVQAAPSADTTVGTAGSQRGVTVSVNRVWNITGIGNAASSASRTTITGINVNYSAGTTVSGNIVHDTTHPGIATDSDRCVLQGNIVSNAWKGVIPSTAPTLGTAAGTLPAGNYTIVYTYVFTSASGQESINSPSATVALSGAQAFTVAALSSIPAGVTAVKIYIKSTTSTSTVGYTGTSATVTANATTLQTINTQGNSVAAPDYAVDKGGIGVVGNRSVVQGNQVFDNQTTKTTTYGCALNSGNHRVIGNDFTGVSSTGIFVAAGGTTNYFAMNGNYNPAGVLTAPSVPATTVAQTNTFGVDATVTVSGGTVTVIAVGGTATGLTSGTFRVPQGQTITLTYSVAPTWKWYGD
jgi:parallel beta-helix repeat protein